MRALTAVGICDEPGPREYSPNSVTSEFTSGGLGDGVKCMSVALGTVSGARPLTMWIQL